MQYTVEELKEICDKHTKWLRDEKGGKRANLTGAYLAGANLTGANLTDANLTGANLTHANLAYAYLADANLAGANLTGANLTHANLTDANLTGAYLTGANLTGAKNAEIHIARTRICPDGQFDAWKKLKGGILCRVRIPAGAKRCNATGRKCRAEYVKVLEVIGAESGVSIYDGKTEYRKGATVRAHEWCEDRWQECAGGIHFYLTREEAAAHQ